MTPGNDKTDGPPRTATPEDAAEALDEIADARRSLAEAAVPSIWPRLVQAVGIGAILALNAAPLAWTPYVLIALPFVVLVLNRRTRPRRPQLNGLQTRDHIGLRVVLLIGGLAVIALTLFGKTLWGWPWWVPLIGGGVMAAAVLIVGRWFDLRVWREWSQR